ncbi:MAG: hypothetical protein UX10_C0004G0021 [Candidatus Magasanikbacteria bacterium GW2011_GWA2_45_39]|uniref:Uncharacterized protein n=2 Tax=Candidatus Magasanikiibacteriota TaxID=1752731 RepID=A0A0G1N0V1_9BACT|nr:MAG: hypothetical protein UX10_C0004G0021 [Candidatus Magasanikbacteria bacterium GW2011_GWA2_45_39]KKU13987.1 MAG: hypothetical protein UX20_C0008G0009 [Candidatus Magasanikbacteria bacterium GW2011_GWC2_45_8]HBW74183.1 hypothetical protein [Candidatus Magasanikbacteria bacterium]
MSDSVQINTFVVQSKNKPLHHALLLLSPSSRSGGAQDRLFVIAEIPLSRGAGNSRIESARLFGSQLFSHYKECKDEQGNASECFEKLIEWANRHVEQFIELKKDERTPTMLIGCLSEEKLFFSISGDPSALIYFKDHETFRDLDLIKTYGGGERENKQAPFFHTLINGELHTDNYVLISTAILHDFLPPERVAKFITENEGDSAADALSKELSTAAAHLAVAGLIISRPGVRKKISAPAGSFTLSTASIKRLIHQGHATEKLLDMSFIAKIKALLLPHLMPRGKHSNTSAMRAKKSNSLGTINSKPLQARELLRNANRIIQQMLLKMGYFLVTVLRHLKQLFSSPSHERRALIDGLRHASSTSVSKWKTRWSALSKKQRLIFGASIIGGLVIALNIAGFTMRSVNSRAQAAYTAQYNTIKEKLDGIESMIIYNNALQARMEARDLQTLIAQFPADTAKHKATQTGLQKSLDDLMLKLRQLTSITPTLVADFGAQNLGELSKLLIGGGWVTAIGSGTHAFTGNAATHETKSIDSPLLATVSAKTIRDAQNYIVAVEGKRLINIQMPSNAVTSLDTIWSAEPKLIKALGFYNNKLYVVDGARGSITKHEPAAKGFGKGVDWLKQPQKNLAGASALTIDGALYVGMQDGTIYRFMNGAGVRMSLDLLDPQLKTITAIYTAKDSPILFILDAVEKRVVLWDKKGALKVQYTAAEFENAKDFAVDERTKEITILAGTKVWKFRY